MDRHQNRIPGFTIIEFLVVLAVLSLLGCLLLPALARTRIQSSGTGCITSLRQMMVGWSMYKDDNDDILLPGSKPGMLNPTTGWYNPVTVPPETWTTSQGNTNSSLYQSGLAPYINGHVELYRCPGDTIPSQNGQRLKSRSMSSQMGAYDNEGYFNANSNSSEYWAEYLKGSDFTCASPKDLFVFTDENFYTMSDGWLQLDLILPDYPRCPAAYHDGAGGFSFADGHAEIHKWMGPSEQSFSSPQGILGVVYQFEVQRAGALHVYSSASDQDWYWLRQHASCQLR